MNPYKKLPALVLLLSVALAGCANTKTNSQTYSEQASSLESEKITTPVFKQSGLMLGSVTLWPDGSEREWRIKSPHEDAYRLAGKVLNFVPNAIITWLGFDYLKADSANDARTAQSRPPVVRPDVVRPEVISPEIIEVPSGPTSP